jgi:xylulokinase
VDGLWLGLDVGTQGTKGVLVDLGAGRIVARAAQSYDLITGLAQGAAEQHPNTWWSAVVAVTRALVASDDVDASRIRGLGVSGQQHGFVPLDSAGEVIRAAKLWCDLETVPEARDLSERLGRQIPAGFTASKILWLKEHEPENFARLAAFALPHDWINLKLTGRLAMEAGDASGTGLFDPRTRAFSKVDAAAIDPKVADMLPELVAADEVLGELTPAAADELGLPAGVLVSPGGGDNMMSAIGSGATESGVVICSLGTSGTVFAYAESPVVDPEGVIAPFCDSTGAWLPLLCVMNLTGVAEELSRAFGMDHGALTEAARAVEAGAGGALFLPYLSGERTPDLPEATGTLLGLRPGSLAPGVLYRAALEGTSANLAWGIDRLRDLGVAVDGVRVVGGGSKNALWCEILAASFGVPVQRLAEPESGALGAALQAAWVVARKDDPRADLTSMGVDLVRTDGPPIEPDPALVAAYADLGQRFRAAVGHTYGQS